MRTKRVVSMVLVVLLLFGMLQLTAFATGFDDVPEYSYYYDAVYWALNQGVTAGTGASTFSPDGTLTRAQIVTFLWKLAGSPMGYQNYAAQFSDVNSSAYTKAMERSEAILLDLVESLKSASNNINEF